MTSPLAVLCMYYKYRYIHTIYIHKIYAYGLNNIYIYISTLKGLKQDLPFWNVLVLDCLMGVPRPSTEIRADT